MKIKPFKDYILFEDDNLIAINKPAMVSSLGDRSAPGLSIQQMAEKYCDTASLCHRLDKETSGVLLISKNPETYRDISLGLQNRQIEKTYWAVVDGRHYFQNEVIDIPISQTSRGKAKVDHSSGKKAKTTISAIETFRNFTLLRCIPESGRFHQIRIHAAVQKAPITADTVYGGTVPYLARIKKNFNYNKDRDPRPMIARTALHAKALEFHYAGKSMKLEAPLPKDFDVLLTLLRKYDAN